MSNLLFHVTLLLTFSVPIRAKLLNLTVGKLRDTFKQYPLLNEDDFKFELEKKDGIMVPRESRGSGSAVRYAQDRANGYRKVALKYVHPDYASAVTPREALNQALNEIEILKMLTRKNIRGVPKFYKAYRTFDNYPVIVMSRLGDENLYQRCLRYQFVDLSPEDSRVMMRQLVVTMKQFEDLNLCHRSLSFSHVTCDENLNIGVVDLGLVEELDDYPDGHSTSNVGAVALMPPEILRAKQATNARTRRQLHDCKADVWSLGLMLWMVLSGTCRQPFASAKWSACQFDEKRKYTLECIAEKDRILNMRGKRFNDSNRDVIRRMMECDQNKRLTMSEVLRHPYFSGATFVPDPRDGMASEFDELDIGEGLSDDSDKDYTYTWRVKPQEQAKNSLLLAHQRQELKKREKEQNPVEYERDNSAMEYGEEAGDFSPGAKGSNSGDSAVSGGSSDGGGDSGGSDDLPPLTRMPSRRVLVERSPSGSSDGSEGPHSPTVYHTPPGSPASSDSQSGWTGSSSGSSSGGQGSDGRQSEPSVLYPPPPHNSVMSGLRWQEPGINLSVDEGGNLSRPRRMGPSERGTKRPKTKTIVEEPEPEEVVKVHFNDFTDGRAKPSPLMGRRMSLLAIERRNVELAAKKQKAQLKNEYDEEDDDDGDEDDEEDSGSDDSLNTLPKPQSKRVQAESKRKHKNKEKDEGKEKKKKKKEKEKEKDSRRRKELRKRTERRHKESRRHRNGPGDEDRRRRRHREDPHGHRPLSLMEMMAAQRALSRRGVPMAGPMQMPMPGQPLLVPGSHSRSYTHLQMAPGHHHHRQMPVPVDSRAITRLYMQTHNNQLPYNGVKIMLQDGHVYGYDERTGVWRYLYPVVNYNY